MNLHSIKDAKETYRLLSSKEFGFPNNFYFVLVAKLIPLTSAKAKKEGNSTTNMKVLGNDVSCTSPKLSLSINGVHIPAEGSGMSWIKSVVIECFKLENSGQLVINRPDNRTRRNDRNDFRKAEGTFFTTLYKSIQYVSGKKDLGTARKGSALKQLFLTEDEYNKYADGSNLFTRHENKDCVYYTPRSVITYDLTDTGYRADQLMFALSNYQVYESAADKVLNIPELLEIAIRPNLENPHYVVVSGKEAFQATSHREGPPTLKPINLTYWDNVIKDIVKQIPSPSTPDPTYVAYKEWLSKTGKKQSKSTYAEFLETPEGKESQIADSINVELPHPVVGCSSLINEFQLDVWKEGPCIHIYPEDDDQADYLIKEIESKGYEVDTITDNGTITRIDVK